MTKITMSVFFYVLIYPRLYLHLFILKGCIGKLRKYILEDNIQAQEYNEAMSPLGPWSGCLAEE